MNFEVPDDRAALSVDEEGEGQYRLGIRPKARPPVGELRIPVSFRIARRSGDEIRSKFYVSARVVPYLEVDPTRLDLGVVRVGSPHASRVRLRHREGAPFRLHSVQAHAGVVIDGWDDRAVPEQILTVVCTLDFAGPYRTAIEVSGSSESGESFSLAVPIVADGRSSIP